MSARAAGRPQDSGPARRRVYAKSSGAYWMPAAIRSVGVPWITRRTPRSHVLITRREHREIPQARALPRAAWRPASPPYRALAGPGAATARAAGDQSVVQRDAHRGRRPRRTSRVETRHRQGRLRPRRRRSGDLLPSATAATRRPARPPRPTPTSTSTPRRSAPRAGQLRADRRDRAHRYGWTVTYTQSYRASRSSASLLHGQRRHRAATSPRSTASPRPDLDLSVDARALSAVAGRPRAPSSRCEPTRPAERRRAPPSPASRPPRHDARSSTASARSRASSGTNVLAYVGRGHQQGTTCATWSSSTRNTGKVDQPLLDDRTTRSTASSTRPTGTDATPTFTEVWEEGDAVPRRPSTRTSRTWSSGTGESYWFFKNTFGRDSYDGAGATDDDGQQRRRDQLPQRQLERHHHQLLQRRHLRRHRLPRVGPRLHRVHLRPDLPVAVRRPQRVLLRHLGRDRRHDQRPPRRGRGRHHRQAHRRASARRTPARDLERRPSPPRRPSPARATRAPASFGPVFDTTGVTTDVVVGTDAADATGAPAPPTAARRSTNAAAVAGKFAYVDRGTCTFAVKVDNAEAAGATGIVIGNNVADAADLDRPATGRHLRRHDRRRPTATQIKSRGRAPSTSRSQDADDDPTGRLLPLADRREVDPAFGGAIRDMWNPNCYGDPGKVSDAEYHCTADDGGGVHTQLRRASTTPTRCWSTAAPSTASTVTGIGLDKAANIFWRTQIGVPDADVELRRPRRRPRRRLRRPGRRSPSTQVTDGRSGRPVAGRRRSPPRTAPRSTRRSTAVELAHGAGRSATSSRSWPRTHRRCAARSSRPRRSGRRTSRTASAGWKHDARPSSSRAATATRGRPRRDVPGGHGTKVAFDPAPDDG